jgi:hypothetical protein
VGPAKEELWRAISQHVHFELIKVKNTGVGGKLGVFKIGQDDVTMHIEKDIFWMNISMDYARRMQTRYCSDLDRRFSISLTLDLWTHQLRCIEHSTMRTQGPVFVDEIHEGTPRKMILHNLRQTRPLGQKKRLAYGDNIPMFSGIKRPMKMRDERERKPVQRFQDIVFSP